MDKTLDPAEAALLSPAVPSAASVRPRARSSGLWLILSAPITMLLTLLAVVYLARLSF